MCFPVPLCPGSVNAHTEISHALSMGISTFVNFLTVSPIKLFQTPKKVSEDLPGDCLRFGIWVEHAMFQIGKPTHEQS